MKQFALVVALLVTSTLFAQEGPKPAEPTREHQWLGKLVGKWECEFECVVPNMPPVKFKGTENIRAVGKLWVVSEGEAGDETMKVQSRLTLGYTVRVALRSFPLKSALLTSTTAQPTEHQSDDGQEDVQPFHCVPPISATRSRLSRLCRRARVLRSEAPRTGGAERSRQRPLPDVRLRSPYGIRPLRVGRRARELGERRTHEQTEVLQHRDLVLLVFRHQRFDRDHVAHLGQLA